jgi:hypothetical protein
MKTAFRGKRMTGKRWMQLLNREEISSLQSLCKPEEIQRYLDEQIAYNKEKEGETCRSVRRVLRDRTAHCLEGAFLAAAALRMQGYPPLLLDLEAIRDDDHVLAIFRKKDHWGAIAKSNYSGLRFREPIYRSLRELAMSYFEHYYNLEGEKTLRRYSVAIRLERMDSLGWMTSEEDVWAVPERIAQARHYPLLNWLQIRHLNRIDDRLYLAGRLGMAE